VLLAVTLAGVLPIRVKFGESEVEWRARAVEAERALADVATVDPDEEHRALAEAVTRARAAIRQLRSVPGFIGYDMRFVDLSKTDLSGAS
jgi:hypothetical protein